MLSYLWSKFNNKSDDLEESCLPHLVSRISLHLRAGSDWKTALESAALSLNSQRSQMYLLEKIGESKVLGIDVVFENALEKSSSEAVRMFFFILRQAGRGQHQMVKVLEAYGALIFRLSKMRQKQKQLSFLPRFQAALSLLVCLLLIFLVPIFSPIPFPTFMSLQRWDLLGAGLAVAGIGVWWMNHLNRVIVTKGSVYLELIVFMQSLQMLMESGQDLVGAWKQSVLMTIKNEKLRGSLAIADLKTESFSDFLDRQSRNVDFPWRDFLLSLGMVAKRGSGFGELLRWYSEQEAERWFNQWEYNVVKFSALNILPLSFLVFPATLFLLLGPLLMEVLR